MLRSPIAEHNANRHNPPMPELVIRRGLAEPDTSASYVPHKPQRPEKSDGGRPFRIQSEYQPAGDQPTAIADLVEGIGPDANNGGSAPRSCSGSPAAARLSPWPR